VEHPFGFVNIVRLIFVSAGPPHGGLFLFPLTDNYYGCIFKMQMINKGRFLKIKIIKTCQDSMEQVLWDKVPEPEGEWALAEEGWLTEEEALAEA
jgi:hypothetical protein